MGNFSLEPGGVNTVGEDRRGYMAKAKRSDTNTPPSVLLLVHHVFGGAVDLDPCSNPASIVAAKREVMLTRYEGLEPERLKRVVFGSGLVVPWEGSAYVNPPFDHLDRWARKCAGEHEARGAEVLLLCPARTDVLWFHAHAPSSSAFCLWKGRITFLGEKHGCPFSPMFMYWGPHVARFREAFGAHGLVLRA
jgi:hypothetical protein